MTKDEMKNRISLALKDPILQQGFEIICKNLTDLEKENAELKEKLNIRSCQNCKRNNKSCPNDGSCKNYSKWKGYENLQLTEAKELLKMVLDWQYRCGNGHPTWQEVCAKIGQFLSEVEK